MQEASNTGRIQEKKGLRSSHGIACILSFSLTGHIHSFNLPNKSVIMYLHEKSLLATSYLQPKLTFGVTKMSEDDELDDEEWVDDEDLDDDKVGNEDEEE